MDLETIKDNIMKIPSVVEVDIPEPPKMYEAFIYRWTNKSKGGKKYLGSHKGFVGDGYLDYWTCDICDDHTHEVDYDYIGSGTNHLSCELKQEELQKKSDKIMKELDKDFKDYDLSKAESNENSKVDMSNNEQTEIEFTEE